MHLGAGQQSNEVQQWAVLECDEVHQISFGRGHVVREEVDQSVKKLRPLSVRLIYV